MRYHLDPTAIYGWLSPRRLKFNSATELAGGAFLLSPTLAVTCAHVVRDHLGLTETPKTAPDAVLALRFEAVGTHGTEVSATVAPNGWFPKEVGGELRDVAFLRLNQRVEAEGLRYPSLAPWMPYGGRSALVIGAEQGYQRMPQFVHVRLALHPNSRGLWQLDRVPEDGFAVTSGFSGAPMLDEAETVVWGMVVEVDARGRPVSFAVGADHL